MTPNDIEKFFHNKQKLYTILYDKVHNRSGEHDRTAFFYAVVMNQVEQVNHLILNYFIFI